MPGPMTTRRKQSQRVAKLDRTPVGKPKDQSSTVLLLIDVINDFQFPDAELLIRPATTAVKNIAALKRRAKSQGIPSIYVNDNFGRWRSDFKALIDICRKEDSKGKDIVEQLLPEHDDYFVLKPKHSAFHQTPLHVMLQYLRARTLILTGLTADNCILLTAGDAHMLEYEVIVPSDCVAAISTHRKREALNLLKNAINCRTPLSKNLKLSKQ